jgi:hypothetical protein
VAAFCEHPFPALAQPDVRLLTEHLQEVLHLSASDGQAVLRRFENLERGIHAQQIENRRFQQRILESLDRLISHADARYDLQSKFLSELIRLR